MSEAVPEMASMQQGAAGPPPEELTSLESPDERGAVGPRQIRCVFPITKDPSNSNFFANLIRDVVKSNPIQQTACQRVSAG